MPVKLTLTGDRELRAKLSDNASIAGPAAEMLRRIGSDAERVAQSGAPDSIARTIHGTARGLQASVTSLHPAALPIEVGRRPGRPMPPLGPIGAWALRHGIQAHPYVLARAIARRGVRGRFFLRAARQHIENRLPRYLDDFAKDVQRRWDS